MGSRKEPLAQVHLAFSLEGTSVIPEFPCIELCPDESIEEFQGFRGRP